MVKSPICILKGVFAGPRAGSRKVTDPKVSFQVMDRIVWDPSTLWLSYECGNDDDLRGRLTVVVSAYDDKGLKVTDRAEVPGPATLEQALTWVTLLTIGYMLNERTEGARTIWTIVGT